MLFPHNLYCKTKKKHFKPIPFVKGLSHQPLNHSVDKQHLNFILCINDDDVDVEADDDGAINMLIMLTMMVMTMVMMMM